MRPRGTKSLTVRINQLFFKKVYFLCVGRQRIYRPWQDLGPRSVPGVLEASLLLQGGKGHGDEAKRNKVLNYFFK